jgi:hypothetical protein
MRTHVLRSRHHQDGSGDGASGSQSASVADMIERAHGTVRSSIGLAAGPGAPAHARPRDGYDAEDMYDAEVATLGGHLAAVEAVVYPVARQRLDGGRIVVAEQQRLSRRIERLMRLIEGRWYGDVYAADMKLGRLQRELARLVEVSRRSELDLARRLDATLTTAERCAVTESFAAAMARPPTRAHPYIPHSWGLAWLAFRACSLWDRALDVMDNRKVPGGQPRRRLKAPTLWDRYVLAPSFDETTVDEAPDRPAESRHDASDERMDRPDGP